MLTRMRIFDTFPFDGELSLFEHRLAETADLVDAFVIVEAGETFQGLPKSMTFADNRVRFAGYDHKIRYVSLPRLGAQGTDPWRREQIQRDAIHFALGDAGPDDIVLILDADEVPSRELLIRLRQDGLDAPRRLLMTRHYQAVDRLGPRSPCCPDPFAPFAFAHPRLKPGAWDELAIDWFSRSGVAAPYRSLMPNEGKGRRSLFEARRAAPSAGGFPDAGRHLCFVDPSARPLNKLGRNAHGELASVRGDPAAHLARCERDDLHHRGWWYAERPTGPLPEDLKRLVERVPELTCKKPAGASANPDRGQDLGVAPVVERPAQRPCPRHRPFVGLAMASTIARFDVAGMHARASRARPRQAARNDSCTLSRMKLRRAGAGQIKSARRDERQLAQKSRSSIPPEGALLVISIENISATGVDQSSSGVCGTAITSAARSDSRFEDMGMAPFDSSELDRGHQPTHLSFDASWNDVVDAKHIPPLGQAAKTPWRRKQIQRDATVAGIGHGRP